MFTTAILTVAKKWKQYKYPLMYDWKKMWYIYTIEYRSAMRKKEILPLGTTCMDLEGIMLSEISQTEKDKYHIISLTCGI